VRRRAILGGLAALPAVAHAQVPGRIPTIGLLAGSTREAETDRLDVFKAALAALGWRAGSTMRLEERYADGDATRIPALAGELVRLKSNVIACTGGTEARALQAATDDIPIVFMQAPDPVGAGLVASIARPAANVTGLSGAPQRVTGKCIQLLVELLGKARRIGFLGNPGNAGNEDTWQDALAAAKQLDVQLERHAIRRAEDIETALAALADADGVFVEFDFLLFNQRQRIAAAALRHRLPSVFTTRAYVVDGGLMSFGSNLRENYRRGAVYVDRILKGEKPSSLPVEQAAIFELVINLKTAKALGLTVSDALLARADEVIE